MYVYVYFFMDGDLKCSISGVHLQCGFNKHFGYLNMKTYSKYFDLRMYINTHMI